jgi:hypothetical protein
MRPGNTTHVDCAKWLLARQEVAGEGPSELARAVHRIYDDVSAELTPILGATAASAMVATSVKLTRLDCEELNAVEARHSRAEPREPLELLAEFEPAVALHVATRLSANFVGLLVDFLGESLALRLLKAKLPVDDDFPMQSASQ